VVDGREVSRESLCDGDGDNRQQWRSQRAESKWAWEWLARRAGQRDWRQGSTAREAIRQETLLPPGWLAAAVAEAERAASAPAVEPADESRGSDDGE
jgi:hypothetical protein